MPNRLILAASRSDLVRTVVSRAPVSRAVVRRFVAGETLDDAVRVSRELLSQGLCVTLDHLGEDTLSEEQAAATVGAYRELLAALQAEGLTIGARAEVSVKLTAVGLDIDPALAERNLRLIAHDARNAGTTVTVDMEGSALTQATLDIVARVRGEHPDLGCVLQAMLARTEADCADQAGHRVRLCKGAYAEPPEVLVPDTEVSYVRSLRTLMRGTGRPLVATHDPRLITLAGRLAEESGRAPGSYEHQLLLGIRPGAQRRLAAEGHTVRVYVPYGTQWYGYLMRRLAERPANISFFLRALIHTR